MSNKSKIISIILIISAIITAILDVSKGSSVQAEAPHNNNELIATADHLGDQDINEPVRLISSNEEGVVLEIIVPWEQLALDPVNPAGKNYLQASLPNWQTLVIPGAPNLPFLTETIGVPIGAEISISVKAGKAHAHKVTQTILPSATAHFEPQPLTQEQNFINDTSMTYLIEEDPEIYENDAFFPFRLAEIANDGIIRQQRVVSIAAYPIQYNPKSELLTIYESLHISVSFSGAASTLQRTTGIESEAYESLFSQLLLNAESAQQWRGSSHVSADRMETENERALPWAPPDPGWRIKIQEDGLYKIDFDDLVSAGFPVDISDNILDFDPQTLKLSNLGEEVAIIVEDETDDEFNEDDYILFFGQSINQKYTLDNVYWLTFGGTPGLRVDTRDATPTVPGSAETPFSYTGQIHQETNLMYYPPVPGEDHLERWFWNYVDKVNPSWTLPPFPTHAPADGSGALEISFFSRYNNASISPDHQISITLNGTFLGEESWDGITLKKVEVEIPTGVLNTTPVDNILTITSVDIPEMLFEWIFIDKINITYPKTFTAEENNLSFTIPNDDIDPTTWLFEVGGFTLTDILLFDVTDPWNMMELNGFQIIDGQFEDTIPPQSSRSYWLADSSTIRTDFIIEEDTYSSLSEPSNGADYIVITDQNLTTEANRLRDYRNAPDFRAEVVDVQDIYDEFNYGIRDVVAIHDFLEYAYSSWEEDPAPSYVVLFGDGHYDSKNYWGDYIGIKPNFIPPYLAFTDPWEGEAAADNRYVTFGEDTMPDMMLGRFPVNDSTEANAMIDKIIAYEAISTLEDWQQQVLAVADRADPSDDFPALSNDLMDQYLSGPYTSTRVHLPDSPTDQDKTNAHNVIISEINAGKFIVNYIGHSAENSWGYETPRLFSTSDISALTNQDRLSIFLTMTCWNGKYTSPVEGFDFDSLAEVITRTADVGAVASWSPTEKGLASAHQFLDQGFFEAVFQDEDGVLRLGQATFSGKLNLWSTGNNLDLLDTFLLFGDPALQLLTVPPKTEYYLPIILY